MINSDELKAKVDAYMDQIVNDPENQEKHFSNLQNYLEGLGDLLTNPLDQTGVGLLKMILYLMEGMLRLKKNQKKEVDEINSNINNILERLKRLEDEFVTMKKGK